MIDFDISPVLAIPAQTRAEKAEQNKPELFSWSAAE